MIRFVILGLHISKDFCVLSDNIAFCNRIRQKQQGNYQ